MAEVNTVARPYTKAAFEYALEKGNLDQWSNALALAAVASQDETVTQILNTPALAAEQKAAVMIDLCADQLDEAGKNFLSLLAENQRLALLPEIAEQFAKLKSLHESSVEIELTTAFELADEQQQALAKALTNKLGREVSISAQVDKAILGGVVIRSDDLVIDGSVRARLAKLAEAMNS